MKKTLFAVLFLLIALYGVHHMFKRNDPAKGEPRIITIANDMTVKQFIEQNRLPIAPWEAQGYMIDADDMSDTMPIQYVDNWIALRVEDGAQSFELPPGRTLHISQQAGRINGFALRPFAKPLPFPEIHDYIVNLVAMLEEKGWHRTTNSKIPAKPEDIGVNSVSYFAGMKSASGNILQLNLRDYGLAPKQESFILNFDPSHQPAAESRTYLLQVTVDKFQNVKDYSDLIYPRRIFVLGTDKTELPLRYWIDDPDWTPEKAGMVPTTPEERPHSYSSKWKMPEQ